ncbi:hypothetical protein M885DRAFT_498790 [Pelagophyceae sp. CCMP2097]|nr:hypothetical protein M885DRAFT_498790 [Pelagophyceae sp. CCMP2097]
MDAVEENTVVRLKTLVRQSNDIPKLYRNLTPDQLLPRWREARDRVLAGGSAAPARDAADALALPAKWLGFVDDLSPRLEQQLVSAAVSDESRRVTVELLGVFEAELACLKTDALRRAARRTMERRGETLEGARKRYGLSADASENDVIDCFLELPLGLWAASRVR